MKEIIGKAKIKKSSLLFTALTDETGVPWETNIANEFNNFCTDIGLKLSTKIPELSQRFESYMKSVSSEMENKPFSISELKQSFFLYQLIKVKAMMIFVIMFLLNVLESSVFH